MNTPDPTRGSRRPRQARRPEAWRDPFALSQLIAAGDIDVVAGDPPVPIAVWRLAGIDAPYSRDPARGLTPRMAVLLVGCYTRPGDTIISVGYDAALAGAAGAGGRTYLSVEDPANLADVDRVPRDVRLVVIPWPLARRGRRAAAVQPVDLFTACRVITGRDGCTIVAFAPMQPDDHTGPIIEAARQTGLDWLHHIVAITAPIAGDQITWRATPTDRATLRAAAHIRIHLDLLVFTPRQTRHG